MAGARGRAGERQGLPMKTLLANGPASDRTGGEQPITGWSGGPSTGWHKTANQRPWRETDSLSEQNPRGRS
jgi:hypothetical protein